MDRRRHARTPVDINAMLIGQKTVPKGCRVRNVSQQGMLLQCEPDGRLLTFSKGDNVEVHLTVEYAGEKKSLTIPSSVRHVNEAYIYVEFQHPDLKLVELIESYRISEAHELEATVGYGGPRSSDPRVTPITDTEATMQADAQPAPENKGSHRPFYYGLLTLVLIICIITGGYIYTASVDNRLGMLETITDRQTSELTEMRERIFNSTLQEGRYASLNARMSALADAFSSLENKLTRLVSERLADTAVQTTPTARSPIRISTQRRPRNIVTGETASELSEPAISGELAETSPTAPATDTQIAAQTAEATTSVAETASPQPAIATADPAPASVAKASETPDETAAEAPAKPASRTSQAPATQAPARQTATDNQGPWVINLLSSPDKGYVERYAARARSKDVAVEMHSAKVKGRTYWRLQITGFATASAAKAGAVPVKKKLGIKDVWILRR